MDPVLEELIEEDRRRLKKRGFPRWISPMLATLTKEVFSDPESAGKPWYYRPVPLAAVSLALTIILNIIFH